MKRAWFVFLSVFVLFSLACGWFDDDVTNISYTETVPLSFSVNADLLCPGDVNCSENTAPAQRNISLKTIEFGAGVDVVELTGNKKLKDFTGVFRSIEITRVHYETSKNSLTFDLPPMKLYMGPAGSSSITDAGVFELAEIPEVPAGTNSSGAATVNRNGRSASSDLLQNLKLGAVLYAKPVIKRGQPFPASGSADLGFKLDIKFTVNPADAL